jgi:hypothetical protein
LAKNKALLAVFGVLLVALLAAALNPASKENVANKVGAAVSSSVSWIWDRVADIADGTDAQG